MVKKDKEIITKIHEEGFKAIVWTVNSPRKIKWLVELGADGICSDYPDRLNRTSI
jgi:glycerophosphoryl diester phosphodiesterase